MNKVKVSYRSDKMLRVLWPARDAGIWNDHGLDIQWSDCCSVPECPRSIVRDLSRKEQGEELVQHLLSGRIDIICGLHFEPYYRKFHTQDDEVVFFGQAVNKFLVKLATKKSSIRGLEDLRGQRVGVSSGTPEFTKNVPLYFLQNGLDVAREGIQLSYLDLAEVFDGIKDDRLDAGLIYSEHLSDARERGIHVVEAPAFPVIYGISPLAALSFLAEHGDVTMKFLKGLSDAIAFYKSEKELVNKTIKQNFEFIYPAEAYGRKAGLNRENDALLESIYEEERGILDERLLPDPIAISNVYTLTAKLTSQDQVVANPLTAWELRFVRALSS